jgi:hypothetical protein
VEQLTCFAPNDFKGTEHGHIVQQKRRLEGEGKARISLILWCSVLAPFFLYFLLWNINIPKMVEWGNPTMTGIISYWLAYMVSLILAGVALATNIIFHRNVVKEKNVARIAPEGYRTLRLLLIIGPIASVILFFAGFVFGVAMLVPA